MRLGSARTVRRLSARERELGHGVAARGSMEEPAPVLRGDGTLITVPVPAGAREVALRYEGRAYARGRVVTILALVIVALGLGLPPTLRRRRA